MRISWDFREESVMSESRSTDMPQALLVAAGADRFGEQRGLGISTIAFKVTTPNPSDIFILENTLRDGQLAILIGNQEGKTMNQQNQVF